MGIVAGFAEVAVRPWTMRRNAVLTEADRHQGRQGLDGLVVGKPRLLLRESDYLDLHNRLVVVRLQGRADGSHLHELGDPDLLASASKPSMKCGAKCRL